MTLMSEVDDSSMDAPITQHFRFFDVEFKRKGKNHDIEYREDGSRVADE